MIMTFFFVDLHLECILNIDLRQERVDTVDNWS